MNLLHFGAFFVNLFLLLMFAVTKGVTKGGFGCYKSVLSIFHKANTKVKNKNKQTLLAITAATCDAKSHKYRKNCELSVTPSCCGISKLEMEAKTQVKRIDCS